MRSGQLGLFAPPPKSRRRGPRPQKGALLLHRARAAVSPRHPHHVTVRVRHGTWSLRSQRGFTCLANSLREVRARRTDFRVVHYSVQGNHVHMLVEADDRRAMSNGLRAVLIRFARALNKMMGAHGSRFADRYHERVLATPSEVRNALKYVLQNHARYAGGAIIDPFSSGPWFRDWAPSIPRPAWLPCIFPPTSAPTSWLLAGGWRRAGAFASRAWARQGVEMRENAPRLRCRVGLDQRFDVGRAITGDSAIA